MKNIYQKLHEFQQQVPILHKDAKGHGYNYTPFATIVEKITPILKKCKLGFYQAIEGVQIKTVVYDYESGENIESLTDLPIDSLEYVIRKNKDDKDKDIIIGFQGMNKAQAYGSLITYFKRYALSSMLGLVTDNDADARNKRIEKENTPLPELPEEKYNEAIKGLKNGITIEKMRKKYIISDELEKTLKEKANETI